MKEHNSNLGSDTFKNIDEDLQVNLDHLKDEFGISSDLSIRIVNQYNNQTNLAIIHLDGIVDDQKINDHILEPIIKICNRQPAIEPDEIMNNIILTKTSTIYSWDKLISSILSGDTIILLNNEKKAIVASTQRVESRSISEPKSQTVIRGPKDSFNENISQNISLVRFRIQNKNLRVLSTKVGSVTKTDVMIMYIEGIADKAIVNEVYSRIKKIKIDRVLESNYIEELIQDNKKTILPQLLNTERPDVVAGNLSEGRIAIFINGTPFVLICPVNFISFFHTPEDYYNNFYYSSLLRTLRVITFIINLYASSLYLALTTHHQGLIPTTLLVSLMAQREKIPFPAVFEILLMEIAFEILREAGIRMPRAIGPAVSIVGALILGQAAVDAGFVSAAVVIIVATSAISSFTFPNTSTMNLARILRFLFLFSSAFIGLLGVLLMTLTFLLHLSSLRSFGKPYFAPFAPLELEGLKDSFIRTSYSSMEKDQDSLSSSKKPNDS